MKAGCLQKYMVEKIRSWNMEMCERLESLKAIRQLTTRNKWMHGNHLAK